MDIKPSKRSSGLKRVGNNKLSACQHSFRVAVTKLKQMYGNNAEAHRVDFSKFKVQIKGVYYPAVLDMRGHKFDIKF